MLDQRRRRWSNIVQMLHKMFVCWAVAYRCGYLAGEICLHNVAPTLGRHISSPISSPISTRWHAGVSHSNILYLRKTGEKYENNVCVKEVKCEINYCNEYIHHVFSFITSSDYPPFFFQKSLVGRFIVFLYIWYWWRRLTCLFFPSAVLFLSRYKYSDLF